MKDWLRFIFSKAFLRTGIRVGFAWGLILLGTWLFLHVYSRHGERIDMPELKGLHLDEAKSVCQGLKISVVHLDSIYADQGRPHHVLEQIPPAGSGIKSGRNIYLTTYRATPPAEFVGVEEGQDLSVARIVLENKGYRVREVAEPNVSLVNRVIRLENEKGQILRPQDRVRRGQVITMYYGRTTSELVAIPDCRGLVLDSARTLIRRSQLSLGLVEFSLEIEDLEDSLEAVVLEQHPVLNDEILFPAGTELDLYLGEQGESPRTAL